MSNPVNVPSVALSRRGFLTAALSAGVARAQPACPLDRYGTPYKYDKLVLTASGEKGAYDSESVDCPFVFRHAGKFHLTFVAFDGADYQTGLATSDDLVHWTKQGLISRGVNRRGRLLSLTPKGRPLLARAAPVWRSNHEKLEALLPKGAPGLLRSNRRALP